MSPFHATIDSFIRLIEGNRNGVGLSLIGAAACIEYLFPPFPGDAVVVFAAFLVARRGWSAGGVMAAVLLGSAAGCMAVYAFGRLVARSEAKWHGRLARVRPQLDRLIERFRRHGSLYLAINRFLPSIRWLFFVAAGMARLPPLKVLAFGLLSALLWNGILFVLGATLGESWPRLEQLLDTYAHAVWVVVAMVALLLVARWVWKRRKDRS